MFPKDDAGSRNMKFFYSFAATMVALLVVTAANAEIYKWTDSNGDIHYSERKPDVKANVKMVIPRNVNASAPRPTVAERDDNWANEQAAEAEREATAAADAEAAATVKQNCEQANKRAASLERPRVNKVDADGTRTRMPEEWRQSQLAEARAAISQYCK